MYVAPNIISNNRYSPLDNIIELRRNNCLVITVFFSKYFQCFTYLNFLLYEKYKVISLSCIVFMMEFIFFL